jgi:hypothetical protein
MNMSNALAKINLAVKALSEAKDLQSVKDIRDKALALKSYASQKKGGEESVRLAQEVIVRAERKMGELLDVTISHTGGRPKTVLIEDCFQEDKTLSDMGISKNQSSKYQKLAEIPEKDFEKAIESRRMAGERITATSVVAETEWSDITKRVHDSHTKVLQYCLRTVTSFEIALKKLMEYQHELDMEEKKMVAEAVGSAMRVYKQLTTKTIR